MASKIRDRIVTTAVRCFATYGFCGCSTKEIAEQANVTEGSLFRLCKSKDKLFTEALTFALKTKPIGRRQLRIAAFALLESRGLTESNQSALKRLARQSLLIASLRQITK